MCQEEPEPLHPSRQTSQHEEVFTSESEASTATCRTVRTLRHVLRSITNKDDDSNLSIRPGTGATSPTPSVSFGSELSLAGLSNRWGKGGGGDSEEGGSRIQ